MSEVNEDIVMPFIEGENVSLCPMNMKNISLYAKWINHPLLRKYAGYNMPKTIEEIKKMFEPKDQQVKNELYFEIWHNNDKKPIGFVAFPWIEWLTRSGYVFYIIDPEYWSRNYGTEVGKLVLDYGFNELNLHKITSRLYPPNKASIRVAEKIGLVLEIRFISEVYIDGEHIDALDYSIFKEDWMKSK